MMNSSNSNNITKTKNSSNNSNNIMKVWEVHSVEKLLRWDRGRGLSLCELWKSYIKEKHCFKFGL